MDKKEDFMKTAQEIADEIIEKCSKGMVGGNMLNELIAQAIEAERLGRIRPEAHMELRADLLKMAEFYGNPDNWNASAKDWTPGIRGDSYRADPYEDIYCYKGGKLAREMKKKWGNG